MNHSLQYIKHLPQADLIQSHNAANITYQQSLMSAVLLLTTGQQTTFRINALILKYEGWNFNSGIYLFTTDTK